MTAVARSFSSPIVSADVFPRVTIDQARVSDFTLLPATLKVNGGKLEGEISSAEKGQFVFSLAVLTDSTVHFAMREKSPQRTRYEPFGVLEESVLNEAAPFELVQDDMSSVVLFQGGKLALHHYPLRITLFNAEEEEVMVVNSRGLLNFEATGARAEEKDAEGNDVSWKESFGSHADSNPHGPSSVAADVLFASSTHVYGLAEHADSLALHPTKGRDVKEDAPYRLYNLDVFEYELDTTMALYGAVPFMVGHSKSQTSGFLWLNAAETFIDIFSDDLSDRTKGVDTHWISESGNIHMFFFLGPSFQQVMDSYTRLTGRPQLPQQFATAYHQCRWNYRDVDDVLAVNKGYEELDIPMDVIWLDIEHTHDKRYFTWDGHKFGEAKRMQEEVASFGRRMVTVVDPHIKRADDYFVHQDATAQDLYVKQANGETYQGWCWPGSVSYLDFMSPAARDYWSSCFGYDKYQSSTPYLYTWNDMNEPSQFNGPEVSMHKDAIHHGGVEHREIHNEFGLHVHEATFNGLLNRNPDRNDRPFVLSRAFFVGSQRYGAVWTGDNKADWSHLSAASSMVLSLGVSGITFTGSDVGGFFGNPSAELFTRWLQAAAWHPFYRNHAHIDTKRREPWMFGDEFTPINREAILVRYHFLPYWYTLFEQASRQGLPMARPIWTEFPQEESFFGVEDMFMVGSAVLVKPVVTEGQRELQLALPGGSNQLWYHLHGESQIETGGQEVTVAAPLERLPVFLRGGSIIPLRLRNRRSSILAVNDPLTLRILLDHEEKATGKLYLDDGHSYEYQNGFFIRASISYENHVLQYALENTDSQLSPAFNIERVVVEGLRRVPHAVIASTSGPAQSLDFESTNARTVVIRKPDLPVDRFWSVSLSFSE